MKIEISQEDYEFLKDLQNELNTQTTDGNAQPVFWGIRETVDELRDGNYCGDPYITYDDGKWTLEEDVQEVESAFKEYPDDYDEEVKNEWAETDKDDIDEVCDFMIEKLNWENVHDVVYFEKVKRLIDYTGAFLTKRACQNYINHYKYNHREPQTYAMTAYRNFELERLLKILKEMKMGE